MKAETIAEIMTGRNWVGLHGDESSWCEIDEPHIYCCVRPEAILRTDIMGMLLQINGRTHEVCMVDAVCAAEGQDWLLVYIHPIEPDIEPMPEEEWNELYGDTKLASASGLASGDDRSASCDMRLHGQVESGER